MKKICLLGYSGHGYVVAEIINLLKHNLVGYIDIEEKKYNPFNLPYWGNENDINTEDLKKKNTGIVFGVGDNQLRKNIYTFFEEKGMLAETLIHPKAVISSAVSFADGIVVMASVVINPLAKIGVAAICNSGCVIEHECTIGDFTHIAPGAVLAGNVRVGNMSFVGANAVIKQGLTIGNNVIIGAGSVVINDVPDNAVVYGNPAKIRKYA